MSDETTLLPCPFCGGEAELVEGDYGMFMTGYAVYCKQCCTKVGVTGRLGEAYEWTPIYNNEAEAIAAWNTRATHGTLTAEQVCECMQHVYYDGYNDGSVHRGHGIEETNWQAIADELNAELGGGTCKCGWRGFVDGWGHEPPNYCPNCGGKAVSE